MMAREYSAAPRHSPNSPSPQLLSGQELQQMRSELSQTTTSGILEMAASTQTHIERLKSRVAELEKRLYGSRAKVHQVMAEMKQLQHTIHQRDEQLARLENEKRAQQFQVGCSERGAFLLFSSMMSSSYSRLHGTVLIHSISFMHGPRTAKTLQYTSVKLRQ